MNQAEERRLKVDRFMRAIVQYVQAEIVDQHQHDADSMGTYHEEQELRESVCDLLGINA